MRGVWLERVGGPWRVQDVADDVFSVEAGAVALCNSRYSSADAVGSPDEILIGWTGTGTARSRRMQQVGRHGSFAERACYPASCVTPLPDAAGWRETALLPFLASLAIADGGLRRGGMRGGQTVVVNGATGNLGGAACSRPSLAVPRASSRPDAAPKRSPVSPDPTLACLDALRLHGPAVLVGGVRHRLPLDYQRIQRQQLTVVGSFMFDPATALEVWQLVRSGALDLSRVHPAVFALDEFDAALDRAEELSGLDYAVLVPAG